jgi:L-alanine-DL-glutamate epimerase-like enolase superfamily enzyme
VGDLDGLPFEEGLRDPLIPPTSTRFRSASDGGQLVVPRKPGLGLAFDQAAIKRYQIG